jgi:hypothetical protein
MLEELSKIGLDNVRVNQAESPKNENGPDTSAKVI